MEKSSMIDLPLDDIIKLNKPIRKRSRPSESVTAAPRFLGSSATVRPVSYFPAPADPYPYPAPPMVIRDVTRRNVLSLIISFVDGFFDFCFLFSCEGATDAVADDALWR